MTWLLIMIVLASGMLLPVQAGINAQLRTYVGHPMVAAVINFILGAR
jgi:transporter family-2 protein